jgi:hypothetical protein
MENSLQNREPSYKEMQELLPDYVFDRLTPEDKQLFESHVNKYPDLQNEIKQVRAVFARVDAMELDKKVSLRTRNLSVKVLNKMEYRTPGQKRLSFAMRYVIPTMAMAALLLIIFTFPGKKAVQPPSGQTVAAKTHDILSQKDAMTLFDDNARQKDFLEMSANLTGVTSKEAAHLGVDDNTADQMWENYLSENLVSTLNEKDGSLFVSPNHMGNDIFDEMENLDESDFQNILTEISNVNIGS